MSFLTVKSSYRTTHILWTTNRVISDTGLTISELNNQTETYNENISIDQWQTSNTAQEKTARQESGIMKRRHIN